MKTFRTICLVLVALAICKVYARAEEAIPLAFKAGEYSMSLYGRASINTAARVKEAVSLSTGVGGDYFITRGFGIGARAELSEFSHSVIDESSARLIARAPLWDVVCPYGYVEGGFQFERNRFFAGSGGGIEVRLQKYLKSNIDVFGEAGLRTTTGGVASGTLVAGVRFPF